MTSCVTSYVTSYLTSYVTSYFTSYLTSYVTSCFKQRVWVLVQQNKDSGPLNLNFRDERIEQYFKLRHNHAECIHVFSYCVTGRAYCVTA